MKRPVKLGIASLKALGAFVALGVAAHAGIPYLPQIGPPPLRVAVVKTPPLNLIKFQETSGVATTNLPAVAEAKTAAVATNVLNLTTPVAPAPFVIETPDQS